MSEESVGGVMENCMREELGSAMTSGERGECE